MQPDPAARGSLLPTLPGSCYTDPVTFAREQEVIFEGRWLCVIRSADIPDAGQFQVGAERATPLVRVMDEIVGTHKDPVRTGLTGSAGGCRCAAGRGMPSLSRRVVPVWSARSASYSPRASASMRRSRDRLTWTDISSCARLLSRARTASRMRPCSA